MALCRKLCPNNPQVTQPAATSPRRVSGVLPYTRNDGSDPVRPVESAGRNTHPVSVNVPFFE